MIDSDVFANVLEKQIKIAVDQSVETYLSKVIDQLIIDPDWISKIENRVNLSMVSKFGEKISMVDVDVLMGKHIDAGLDRWQQKLKKDFSTTGIQDAASRLTVSIQDDLVSVNGTLIADQISVMKDASVGGTLTVNDLVLKGTINVDNQSWGGLINHIAESVVAKSTEEWKKQLVDDVFQRATSSGIDFSSVSINGFPLIVDDVLNSNIKKSGLTQVGRLESLEVAGSADINNTIHIRPNRLGINTDAPEMALSVWDEEVSIIAGKLNKDRAYVGTSRLTNLSIGINRQSSIDIDTEGLTTIKKLRIGQHRMMFEKQVPGWSGTRGDMVFNSDPKPGQPFAWQCLGGFQWQSLKAG